MNLDRAQESFALSEISVASLLARWRALTAVINSDLTGLVGPDHDEIVTDVLDRAREETLDALANLPVTSRDDASGLVSVAGYLIHKDQRSDGLEARLLRLAADFFEREGSYS